MKVLLDTGIGKVLLYSYENLGGREGGREGGRGGGAKYGVRGRGEMERWKTEARSDEGMKG